MKFFALRWAKISERSQLAFGPALILALVFCGPIPETNRENGRSAAPAASDAQIVLGPVKVRPYDSLPPKSETPLSCAKNEFCSLQLVVTARGEDLDGIDVEVSELSGPEGARIPSSQFTVYREEFLNVFHISDKQGLIGEWPDPLIPKVDPEYREKRNAFPFSVHRMSRAYKKYLLTADKSTSRPGGRGTGDAVSGGTYTGQETKKFVVQVQKAGTLGTATFRWAAEPGEDFSPEAPVTSEPVPLADGVTVTFRSHGDKEQDFLTGDEFWIFVGPYRHQPLWIDLLVPQNARSGTYAGTLRLTRNGSLWKEIPVQFVVLDFALPSTSSLSSYFGMYWPGLYSGHYGPGWDAATTSTLGRLYATAALRNSITVAGGTNTPPTFGTSASGEVFSADFGAYDAAVGLFMDGRGTPRGAKWTSLPLPRFRSLAPQYEMEKIRRFVEHLKQRGWYDRVFDYSYDEPHQPQQFQALQERARLVAQADPQLPRLATTDLNEKLFGVITRWCPLVNHLDPRPVPWQVPSFAQRPDYESRLRQGDQLWWYQSCMSHGCGLVGAPPEYKDWPTYMVDASGVANRVFGLMSAVTYKVSGILYWDVANAYIQLGRPSPRKLDIWESVYYFGGNGDGVLFYPGRPEQIGGKHHIPIESLRLKMIRDGFYDADLASMLRSLNEEEFLETETQRVIQKTTQWNADPQAWVRLREALAQRIVAARARRAAP